MAADRPELKSGYLEQDFRLFHIKDKTTKTFSFHYHDFHKIILFLSGKVTYQIEGKSYFLTAGDILLVNASSIHKAVVDPAVTYERIILWVRPEYMKSMMKRDDITDCFEKSLTRGHHLIRTDIDNRDFLQQLLLRLEQSLKLPEEFGSALLNQSLFAEFMVYLNRIYLNRQYEKLSSSLSFDPQITGIMKYINEHLTEDLNLETLAGQFFISKYYLMHKFKSETGYTVHNYILQKRLAYAKRLVDSENLPITKAASLSGFHDYSSFYRAYKKERSSRSTANLE